MEEDQANRPKPLTPKNIETEFRFNMADDQSADVYQRYSDSDCWLSTASKIQQMQRSRKYFNDEYESERGSSSTQSPHSPAPQQGLSFSSRQSNNNNATNDVEAGRDRFLDSLRTRAGWRRSLELPSNRGRFPSEDAGLPADRYFDALQGPELDILKPSEHAVLPEDKVWPFLLRFPISAFGICMGVGSQSILWKTLAESPSTEFLGISPAINFVLWCITLLLLVAVSVTYTLKAIFYFEAIPREFYHPVRVNFFFAPWVATLFLVLGLPPSFPVNLKGARGEVAWYVLMAPILLLELKIYGQWMFGGRRRLSKVANPSNHLSIVGNFVGALLGASLGLKEGPIFFFAVGLAHYAVLLVTLYQRLPTNEALPKELHPVFFLFVAVPTVAAMAWSEIRGTFDDVSRIPFFLGLFLYSSLVVRINLFRGFRETTTQDATVKCGINSDVITVSAYRDRKQEPLYVTGVTSTCKALGAGQRLLVWCCGETPQTPKTRDRPPRSDEDKPKERERGEERKRQEE
ncbi:S-type anion channel SLAH2-like isoform X3 [Wolffia australiana]